jgi:hypothetical protein
MSNSILNTCVVVPQESYAIIGPIKGCPTKIATFGCGPCVGALLVKGNVAGLVHLSVESLIHSMRTMIYIMMDLFNETSSVLATLVPTEIYLIGGQHNESVKVAMLKIIFSGYFGELNPVIKSDESCCYPHISSIMFDVTTGIKTQYLPTGRENIDVNQVLCSLYSKQITCCYNARYPESSCIIDLSLPNMIKECFDPFQIQIPFSTHIEFMPMRRTSICVILEINTENTSTTKKPKYVTPKVRQIKQNWITHNNNYSKSRKWGQRYSIKQPKRHNY